MHQVDAAGDRADVVDDRLQRIAARVVTLGEAAQVEGFRLVQTLRKSYVTAEMNGEGKSMKSQLKHADKNNAKYVIILGDDELARQEAIVRTMETGEQETVALADVAAKVTSLVKG